jgi:hypothetical protein
MSDAGVVSTRGLVGTVALQMGMDGYTGAADTYILEGECSETSFAGEHEWAVSNEPRARALLRFDLEGVLPTGAEITQAILSVRAYSGGPDPIQVNAHRVNVPWQESEASWIHADASAEWHAPGCAAAPGDRSADVAAFSSVSALNAWYRFDISAMAQDWLANPTANHGLILIPVPGPNGTYRFFGAESPHAGWRPVLTLSYRVP